MEQTMEIPAFGNSRFERKIETFIGYKEFGRKSKFTQISKRQGSLSKLTWGGSVIFPRL